MDNQVFTWNSPDDQEELLDAAESVTAFLLDTSFSFGDNSFSEETVAGLACILHTLQNTIRAARNCRQ